MFDIGWSELLLIAIVAIVVVGPKDLPPMLRAFGRTVGKMRRMAGDFQSQFNEALREAELDDVKKTVEGLRDLDPMRDIRDSLNPISSALSVPEPAAIAAPVPPAAPAVAAETPVTTPADPPKPVMPAPVPAAAEPARAEATEAAAEPAKKKPATRKPKAEAGATEDVNGAAVLKKPRAPKAKAEGEAAAKPARPRKTAEKSAKAEEPSA